MIDKLIMLVIGLAVGFLIGFVVCAVLSINTVSEARDIIDREQRKEL